MKQLTIINLLLTLFLLPSMGQVEEIDLNLLIYPWSGGDIGYEMGVQGTSLKVNVKKLQLSEDKIVLGEVLEAKERKLTKRQISKIDSHLEKIMRIHMINTDEDMYYDSWVFDVFINGKKSIRTNSIQLHRDQYLIEVNEFVEYLLKISPITIEF